MIALANNTSEDQDPSLPIGSSRKAAISSSADRAAISIDTSPITVLKADRVKVAQLELHVTTLSKGPEGIRRDTAMTVLCSFYRNIYKTLTMKRAAHTLGALKAAGVNAEVTLYSKRGKPLMTISAAEKSAATAAPQKVAAFNSKADVNTIIETLAKSGATKVVVQTASQLAAVKNLAARFGLEAIYAPIALMVGNKQGGLVKPLLEVESLRISEKTVGSREKNRAAKAGQFSTTTSVSLDEVSFPSRSSLRSGAIANPSRNLEIAQGITALDKKSHATVTPITVTPALVRSNRLGGLAAQDAKTAASDIRIAMTDSDRELLKRITASIERDRKTAKRPSLDQLIRASAAIEAAISTGPATLGRSREPVILRAARKSLDTPTAVTHAITSLKAVFFPGNRTAPSAEPLAMTVDGGFSKN